MPCNWGVLGAGFIANRAVIPAIQHTPDSGSAYYGFNGCAESAPVDLVVQGAPRTRSNQSPDPCDVSASRPA